MAPCYVGVDEPPSATHFDVQGYVLTTALWLLRGVPEGRLMFSSPRGPFLVFSPCRFEAPGSQAGRGGGACPLVAPKIGLQMALEACVRVCVRVSSMFVSSRVSLVEFAQGSPFASLSGSSPDSFLGFVFLQNLHPFGMVLQRTCTRSGWLQRDCHLCWSTLPS